MPRNTSIKLALYGGAGIGLLFGIVMGSSIAPIAAKTLAVLATLLAAMLGLNDKYFNDAKSVRIGSFGFACVLGIIIGMFVRANNILSPSMMDLKQQYLAVGFSEEEALHFIVIKEFGGTVSGSDSSVNTPQLIQQLEGEAKQNNQSSTAPIQFAQSIATAQHASVLFSSPVELNGCDELEYTDNSLPLDEVVNNFELTGGVWEDLVDHVPEQTSLQDKKGLLLTTKHAVCQVEQVEEQECDSLTPEVMNSKDYESIFSTMSSLDQDWHTVASSIDTSSLHEDLKLHSLKMVKNTLCGF